MIEEKTSDAILEKKHKIEIGHLTYDMPQPTLATLIMVSEETAGIPNLFDENVSILDWALQNAGNARKLARIAAIFVLGGKHIKEGHKIPVKRKEIGKTKGFWFIKPKKKVKETTEMMDELDWMTDLIVNIMSPRELSLLLYRCMSMLEVKDFFAVTASLSGVNLTRRTEAVIQSGD